MARKYKPATFQPTVRPDWGGILSYLSSEEKSSILEALIKYPSIKCNSKFWLETIKPDLDIQYEEFTKQCEAKSRAVRNRWGKTSITPVQHKNNKCNKRVIVSEGEGEGEGEGEREGEGIKESKDEEEVIIIKNKLKDILNNHYDRRFDSRSWGKDISLLMTKDLVSFERIEKALYWYAEHIGGEYIPVIQSAKSLREKFIKLEDAMTRTNKRREGTYTTYSATYGEDVPL